MAITQLETATARCPNCPTQLIEQYDYLSCPGCGHVPFQGAD